MQQQYPYFNRRSRRREYEYYQSFPYYNQPIAGYQNSQNLNSMYTQQMPNSFNQVYQQQFQQPFQQPYTGGYESNINSGGYFNNPYTTPYPKPMPHFKQPQPTGMQTILSQFKKSDGQLDFNKMMDTAGQMMSAVNQMGGLFKGVTSMFK